MEFAQNASKLHKKVGWTLLEMSLFKGCNLQQEVIVSDLFPEYYNGRDRYDWVIPDHFTIIECHGIQHYKVQSFGADAGEALLNFQSQKFKDGRKKEIALLNGWNYIEIPYTDEKKITPEYLLELITSNQNPNSLQKKAPAEKPEWYQKKHKADLERARIYRKQQRELLKEKLNERKKSSSNTSSSSDEEA